MYLHWQGFCICSNIQLFIFDKNKYIYIYIYINALFLVSLEGVFLKELGILTLNPLTWKIWWPNNASRWQMGFNSAFKGLIIDKLFFNNFIKRLGHFFCNIERFKLCFGTSFFCPMPPHVLFVEFVALPPGRGRIVTDVWSWGAHEAQLRCPNDVWVVIEEEVGPGGALNLNSTNLPRPWSPWGSSPSRKISTVELRIEPRTSWLVSSQRLWPLDHDAGHKTNIKLYKTLTTSEPPSLWKTTTDDINNNQIPVIDIKNSVQEVKDTHSDRLTYQCTQEYKDYKIPESKLCAWNTATKELVCQTCNQETQKLLNCKIHYISNCIRSTKF